MHKLSNEIITIKVQEKGAELVSIVHKENNLEYIWSARPVWPKTSPILFPVVGGLKNSSYRFKGKEYTLPRHGFARDHFFEVDAQTDTSITFLLESTEKIKADFPFDFAFRVIYTLNEATLSISFIVENTGNETMYFSVGAHPAFAVPLQDGLAYSDYYLRFDENETLPRWPINNEGNISNTPIPFLVNAERLPLQKELFDKDAIVLKNMKSSSITLRSDKSMHGVKVDFEGFPYMGIWAAKGADFVCIEPWCGIADHENATGNLNEKEGIKKLDASEIFTKTYSISVF